MNHTILIIGGGASGMAAAISAARTNPDARITILDDMPRIGKKLLATGNGRCNLTNTQIAPERYHSTDPQRLASLLEAMPAERTLAFFRSLGLYCAEEDRGRVYPYSRQAATVLDILLLALRRHSVEVRTDTPVTRLFAQARGFSVQAENGAVFSADAVILTAGGRAAPMHGTRGTGYPLAQAMGHRYARVYPCLVPVLCKERESTLRLLKGVRANACATLLRDGEPVGADTGEIQFTDRGLSGIPIFQLSCLLRPVAGEPAYSVRLDLLPDLRYDEVREILRSRVRAYPGDTPMDGFLGLVHPKLLAAALEFLSLPADRQPLSSLSRQDIDRLVSCLKGWRFPVSGVSSWAHAQATGGGVFLSEIDDKFQSLRRPGLFFAGEILDVIGECGGYNLHWAWCSGLTAGKAAAEFLSDKKR